MLKVSFSSLSENELHKSHGSTHPVTEVNLCFNTFLQQGSQ